MRSEESSKRYLALREESCKVPGTLLWIAKRHARGPLTEENKEHEENDDHRRDQCSIAVDAFCAQRMRIPAGEGRRGSNRPDGRRAGWPVGLANGSVGRGNGPKH